MSAHDAYHNTGSSKDFEEVTRIHLGLQELINDKSSSASANPANLAWYHSSKASQNVVRKEATLDSIGSINIVTKTPGVDMGAFDGEKADPKTKVVDLNRLTTFPLNVQRKKNKNDFYRFLLQQNFGNDGAEAEVAAGHGKVNNDILIPRSILKKNEAPKRYQTDKEDFDEFEELLGPAGPDQIAPNEAVLGKHLDKVGPMLSPRTFNQNYLENRYKKMEIQE